jgi:uncharacterized protein (DUF488 family)
MYQRQKEILYVVWRVGRVGKTKLQKLLFLANLKDAQAVYSFFPYNYGPFSLVLQSDLEALCKQDVLTFKDDKYQRPVLDVLSINASRRAELDKIIEQFGDYNTKDLLEYVYSNFPKYAVNSKKAVELLSRTQMADLKRQKQSSSHPCLFTIGYEHKSIDKYLRQLIENNVRLVVDVRANSFSMKKEFIGGRLASACKHINIEYLHIPQLGIPNTIRKEIADKKSLFRFYADHILPEQQDRIRHIDELMLQYKRIALTCFEAEERDCHRGTLAKEIMLISHQSYCLEHL